MIGPERYAPVWSIGDGIEIHRRPQGTQAADAASWQDYRPRGRLGGRRVPGSLRSDKALDIAEPQGAGFWLNTGWGVGGKGWLRTRCEGRFARARDAQGTRRP